MRNPRNSQQRSLHSLLMRGSLSVLFSLGLTVGLHPSVRAASLETAPPELAAVLRQIEEAANRHNLDGVLTYYSPTFTNSDNLDRDEFSEAIAKLWERYPDLTYRTELQSWERRGDGLAVETTTYITGTQNNGGQAMRLEATLRSRQVIQNNQIVRQEILSERSQLSVGVNPPQVSLNLPERVRPGEKYSFDAIVSEPLGDRLLLGAALDEKIEGDRYLNPGELELELLQAGGLFKVGQAPKLPEDRWISAILIRDDGITVVSQRLQVGDSSSALKPENQE